MQIKILINNIFELSYLIICTNQRKKFVRITKGHPIHELFITREVYNLESVKKEKEVLK